MIDESIGRAGQSGYQCIVAAESETRKTRILGYICFGQTPMTDHCHDLYWIIVDPAYRKMGIGKSLLTSMEKALLARDGHLIRVETSSTDNYSAAGRFYQNEGFTIAGRIPDFYSTGDDLVIYIKNFI